MDANGISIHFEIAGHGPSVVLLHEMGGTLDSWDGIFPGAEHAGPHVALRPARLRAHGKVRQPYHQRTLVEDLEAVLQASGWLRPTISSRSPPPPCRR